MNTSFEKAITMLNAHKLNEGKENRVRMLLTEAVTCYRQQSFYGLTDNIMLLGDALGVDNLSKDDQVTFTENINEIIRLSIKYQNSIN